MIKSHFKSALRNIWGNKIFSFINIFGLAISIACSLLIFLFVKDEISYDRFNKDANHTYRVVQDFINDDGTAVPDATTPPAVAPAMQREIPDVICATRLLANPDGDKPFCLTTETKNSMNKKYFLLTAIFLMSSLCHLQKAIHTILLMIQIAQLQLKTLQKNISVVIILIAAINYVNLATAKAAVRAKEVGIRKVTGASRSSLISQFPTESIIACLGCRISCGNDCTAIATRCSHDHAKATNIYQ